MPLGELLPIQWDLERDVPQHSTFLYLSKYMEDLGEKLSQLAPGGLNQCYFTNSGSEANEMAVMSARVATGEQTMIALRHGYHGGTNVPLSLCGNSQWKFPAQPQASVVHAVEPYCYRCPYGAQKGFCALECAEDIQNVIETATHGKVAGLIVEPVLGVGGFIDPPLEYHRRAAEIVRNVGGKYLSDEVQTGVGRTGKFFFAIEESEVVPDIITMAKGFGGGAPIGAVVAKKEIAMSLKGKTHFNTFGGDPYQSMQAGEVIDIIKDEELIENAHREGKYLKEGFQSLSEEFPVLGDVRGRGLMIGIELVKDPKTKEPAAKETAEIMDLSKERGLLLGKGGLKGNVIRIAPSLSIRREESEELLKIMKSSLQALRDRSMKK